MKKDKKKRQPGKSNRREFIKSASAAAATAGGMVAIGAQPAFGFHSGVDETLKIGLIGCGGRGTGAVTDALRADPDTEVFALADAFRDRLDKTYRVLERQYADRLKVDEDHKFTGLTCGDDLIASDVDVVLLCTPPHFRPAQVEAAIKAKKHIFCEKPVAVDAPGLRRVDEACKSIGMDDISIVSGLCWRYDDKVREVMRRIKDGAIGEIRSIQENYLTGTLWHRGNKPDWSPLEYQLRNWLYYTWLSGDHIAEQHIHSLDKAMWLMDDEPPVKCVGMGGRQVRTDEKWGHVYDHFGCCFEWENGVKTHSYTRQMANCHSDVDDYVVGTKGTARILRGQIRSDDGGDWNWDKKSPSMYLIEHQHLFKSIREGEPINNGDYMCKSTMMAILGREACYTGKEITWDEMMASDVSLGPAKYDWDVVPETSVAMPGQEE